MVNKEDWKKQLALYLFFAAGMILFNYVIQKSNQVFVYPWVCQNYGDFSLIRDYYCSTEPYDMPELVGSMVAVGITYVVKFVLDKMVVFKKTSVEMKQTSQEFFKYLGFAILTTIENIGIQFLLTNFVGTPLEISMIVALTAGYATKFVFDRKFVFVEKE